MKQNHTKGLLLFSCMFLPPLVLLFIQRFFEPNYLLSSSYKILFFLPLVYRFYFHKHSWKQAFLEGFSFANFRKYILHALGLGLLFSLLYFFAFFIFKEALPLDRIVLELDQTASITVANILFIGLYIIFINSLLEEFFWRGFFFNEVHILYGWFAAYFLTGMGFSLYHIAYFYHWFSYYGLFVLASAGLFLYSIFMCMIFRNTRICLPAG